MSYREILSIDPPPSSVPMYTDSSMRTMNVAWVRWFQNVWERVGGSTGDLIYDAANASTMSATLIPQISAVRSELGQELSSNTLFSINQAAALRNEQPPSITLSVGQREQEYPFSNFAAAAMAINASRTLTLDEVLTNGNTSTLGLTTGTHIISSTSGPSVNYIDTGATKEWRTRYHPGTSTFQIYDHTTSNTRLAITDTNGYILLGIDTAYNTDRAQVSGNLSIKGASVTSLRFLNGTNAQTHRLLYDPTNTRLALRNDTSGNYVMAFHDATDNVTIGTTVDDGVNRLQVSGGVAITGTATAGAFSGVGTSLTALNASNISSGTLNAARLATSGVGAGSYSLASITVDAAGRVTAASSNALSAGTGISVGGLTITNTGVTSVIAGTDISVSGATGAVTITNTNPSDYRLKENIVSLEGAIGRTMKLRPVRYNFIKTPEQTVDGFIAHEAQEVVPEAVIGVKDGPEMQSMSNARLVPLLTKTIQEQQLLIENLTTRLEKLEQAFSNR